MATASIRMSLLTGRTMIRPTCMASRANATKIASPTRRLLTTSTPSRASSTPSTASTTSTTTTETMDWNTYFALRRTRRNYERVFMVPCALLGLGGAGYYFAQQDFDPTPIFGMDQMIVYAAGTIAAGIVGLATGPVVGNIVFRAFNSKAKPLIDR
ncbi:TIM23 complex component, partial [Gryganskiella cystojenkinii]